MENNVIQVEATEVVENGQAEAKTPKKVKLLGREITVKKIEKAEVEKPKTKKGVVKKILIGTAVGVTGAAIVVGKIISNATKARASEDFDGGYLPYDSDPTNDDVETDPCVETDETSDTNEAVEE